MKISVVSQLLIEADGEWAVVKAAEDPNALVAIVYRTHFPHVGGATPAMAKINMQNRSTPSDKDLREASLGSRRNLTP
jgi:hypothetical protein